MLARSLDSRLRGNDGQLQTIVIPAKAGIQLAYPNFLRTYTKTCYVKTLFGIWNFGNCDL